jgi:hypothetical protein
MRKYLIRRPIPGAGQLSADELSGAATKSNETLDAMAGRAQWIQSYVTDDALFCVYIAEDEAAVHEHAQNSGFLCDSVLEVRTIIDPTTAAA